ncbi:sulfurtransferase [Salinibacillus aidingensis]|uniref:Sulfurtransferase n=1 Tax=Salinibacillus aidingensis TaxID=237684 RepID=A0ABN1B9D6_9BACI
MSFLISVDELKTKMDASDEMVIVDTRFELTNPGAGRAAYLKGHIPQAFYLDLNKDLAGEKTEHGGNHPLPDINEFAQKIGNIGIDQHTTVIVYDQGNEMFSGRCWWLLHYLGHESVYVLDGGLERWQEKGYEITTKQPVAERKTFIPKPRADEVVDIHQVKEKLQEDSAILIDSRSKDRYLGKNEPLYKKAGHIPGAINYFYKDVLSEDGRWKDPDDLSQHFASLPKDKEIMVSCGSGVSATPNIMALKMAGFHNVKLYPGSFSDWISYDENEVETEDE